MIIRALGLAAILLTPQPANADDMPGMAPDGAASKQFMDGMATMDTEMKEAPMTGDVDHDFAAMMIPHHRGAVSMAETELRYGHDPVMRKLARDIVAAQHKEITLMQGWLAKRPTR